MNEQRDELELNVLVDQIVFDRPATHLREASYSTDIEAAFEVEAVMRARGFQMRLRGPAENGLWEAAFIPRRQTAWRTPYYHWQTAPTAPLAICLAALRAILGGDWLRALALVTAQNER